MTGVPLLRIILQVVRRVLEFAFRASYPKKASGVNVHNDDRVAYPAFDSCLKNVTRTKQFEMRTLNLKS